MESNKRAAGVLGDRPRQLSDITSIDYRFHSRSMAGRIPVFKGLRVDCRLWHRSAAEPANEGTALPVHVLCNFGPCLVNLVLRDRVHLAGFQQGQ